MVEKLATVLSVFLRLLFRPRDTSLLPPTINHLQEITGTSEWYLETFVKSNASSRPDTFVVMRSNKVSFIKFESVKYPESHLLEWPLERRHCLNRGEQKWEIKIVSKSKYSPVGLFTEVEIACLKFAEMKTSQRNVIKPRNVSERQAPKRSSSNFEFRIWRGENGWSFGKVLMGPTSTALVTTENNDVHLHHENPPLLMHFVTALNRKFLRGRFLKAGQATPHCSALRLDCTTVNGFTRLATVSFLQQ